MLAQSLGNRLGDLFGGGGYQMVSRPVQDLLNGFKAGVAYLVGQPPHRPCKTMFVASHPDAVKHTA